MSTNFESVKARAANKANLLRVTMPKGIKDGIELCEILHTASLVESISPAARDTARLRFLSALDSLDKRVKAFEDKEVKTVYKSGHDLLTDEQIMKRAIARSKAVQMSASYREQHTRRMQELDATINGIDASIPAEQRAEFASLVNQLAQRGLSELESAE